MPRETLKIAQRVESLSVLTPEGQVDRDLEPRIPDADLRRLYQMMLAARRLDERCLQLHSQGRLGTYAPGAGQEAASLGAVYALTPEDWLVPTFRELAAMLWRGWPMQTWLLFFGGFEAGNQTPQGVNDLPICVPIASQCQYGMGLAWGCKLRGQARVCVTFCGDGGTSEGDFHEALNFAGVYQLPLIVVVQNNGWAISCPRSRQTASATLAQKAIAYGFDGLQVDGNDLLGVIVAVREAVAKARGGGGPTLIEALTYRLGMHTTADDPRKYRTDEEVQAWQRRDPLTRFRTYLQGKRLLDATIEKVIDEEVDAELAAAVRDYEQCRADPVAFFQHMYAEPTPELQRQMAELRAHLEGSPAAPQAESAAAPQPRPPAEQRDSRWPS